MQDDLSPQDLQRFSRLDEREVKIRWHHEWWDGPLDGIIEYRSFLYWFSFYCDTDEPGNPYYYLVYPLSAEEVNVADQWFHIHEKFGEEWRPLANNSQTRDLRSTEALGERWQAHRATLPDFTKREPVAFFTSGVNRDFYAVHIEPA